MAWKRLASATSTSTARGIDPSSPYSGVLSLFLKAALERTRPTIFGDGELKAARAADVAGRIYNGGNGGRITLNQAWAMVQRLEGVDIPPIYGAPRKGDVRDSQADTRAAVRELGHAPKYSFEEGMRLTLEWYRKQAAVAK
jgi:UDP-glucose 4-epimerase